MIHMACLMLSRTRKAELVEDIPDSLLVELAQDEAHLRILRDVGVTFLHLRADAVEGQNAGRADVCDGGIETLLQRR